MENKNNTVSLFLVNTGNEYKIEQLYNLYREQFIAFVNKHYTVDEDIIIDIYQESFIALYENIINKKISPGEMNVSVKTYLFSIGRNKLCKYFRDTGKYIRLEDSMIIGTEELNIGEHQQMIQEELDKLCPSCRMILKLYYFDKEKMKEIASIMGYANEQVVKNKRLSCFKKLKENVLKRYGREDFFD